MKNECPHCGETYSALKNHIRLASGGGHGSSGSYPEEDETNERTENSDQKEEELNITTEELEARLKQASDNAYKAGREDERREREQQLDQEVGPSAGNQTETATTVPAAEGASETTSSNLTAAAGGLAALILLSEGLESQESEYSRKRM